MNHNVEKQIKEVFRGKLLCVNDLMELDDYDTVRELLFNNPIHYIETFYEMIRRKQWSKLASYAQELEIPYMADLVHLKMYEQVEKYVYSLYWDSHAYVYENCEPYKDFQGNLNIHPTLHSFGSRYGEKPSCLKYRWINSWVLPRWDSFEGDYDDIDNVKGSLAECVAYVDECKEEILKIYLTKKEEKRKQQEEQEKIKQLTDGVTKELLLEKLDMDDTKAVIEKLYNVLIAKLQYIHHRKGTLYEIIENFVPSDSAVLPLLKRLIKNREAFDNADVYAREMLPHELKICIDYIFDKIPSTAKE